MTFKESITTKIVRDYISLFELVQIVKIYHELVLLRSLFSQQKNLKNKFINLFFLFF